MPHLIRVSVGVAPQRDVFHVLFVVSSLPFKARGRPPPGEVCLSGQFAVELAMPHQRY